jgi:polysaccharide pyruvyl transferase WcaK-like protein
MSRNPNPVVPSLRRLLVIADVGGEDRRHIGDEAMLEANLAGLRRLHPEVAFTVVSPDPAWTAARYGVDSVPPFGFPSGSSAASERAAMLDRLLSAGASGSGASPAAVALAESDGLVLSGGGNLSSSWPDLLYERAALLHLARIFGKPAVVLGQTLGPRLEGHGRRLLAETLPSARFVGVREVPTAALALALGVPSERLWYQTDDAFFFEPAPRPAGREVQPHCEAIAVTIDPQLRAAGERLFHSLADQLRRLSEASGASLLLIPHAFGREREASPSDRTEAGLLAERIALPDTVIAEQLDAAEVRRITGEAALIISTRYHPLVFGVAAAIPSIGIYGDEYCRIKLQGALAHAAQQRSVVSYDAMAGGELLPRALTLWETRHALRGELESRRPAWREEWQQRWSAIAHALDGRPLPSPSPATTFGRPTEVVLPALVSALEARRQEWERERSAIEQARSYTVYLENQLGLWRSLRRWTAAVLRRLGVRKAKPGPLDG